MTDPYRHHPGLRGKIEDPLTSFFRTFDPAAIEAELAARGLDPMPAYPDDVREAFRNAALEDRRDSDLWVFAYGSLMWNPAFLFEEVRRAHLPGFARRFILKDVSGGRGTPDHPGVMAALDRDPDGPGCDGLAFRIAAERLEEETDILWRRERISPCYHEEFLPAGTDHGEITVLAFAADHDADMIHPDLSHADQVAYAATGEGILGTSLEYIENLAEHFEILKIEDADMARLLSDARDLRARS
ncbi:gamma-glutamylcyclotransferase [Psychromarinibacter sp. S121]|uniref:gamma-glutamylcyclotransferase n=1 Tax=Psychromarinibacter sp. S121 TaxID=3415127 RepID=UPI003C7C34E2